MALTRDERERFLAEPHVAALAVAEEGRGPLTVPVWYQYEPGGDVWIMTGADSRKAKLIEAAGRFSLLVERVQPTVRYVSVEGPVVATTPATKEQAYQLAARYLPADQVEGYVEWAWQDHGAQIVLTLRPERWYSADLGAF